MWLIQRLFPFSQLPTRPINMQNDTYYHLENTEHLCQRTTHRLAQQWWSHVQRLGRGLSKHYFFSATQPGEANVSTKEGQSQFHGSLYSKDVSQPH